MKLFNNVLKYFKYIKMNNENEHKRQPETALANINFMLSANDFFAFFATYI